MDIKDLKFIRCTMPETFQMIPRYLMEQVDMGAGEDRVDKIYQNGLSILMVPKVTEKGIEWVPNPLVSIILMVDDHHMIKGVLWTEVDLIERHLFVHALTLDKEYQSNGQATEKVLFDEVMKLVDRPELQGRIDKRIVMMTSRPKAYERFGFRKSKKVLMEIDDGWRQHTKTT